MDVWRPVARYEEWRGWAVTGVVVAGFDSLANTITVPMIETMWKTGPGTGVLNQTATRRGGVVQCSRVQLYVNDTSGGGSGFNVNLEYRMEDDAAGATTTLETLAGGAGSLAVLTAAAAANLVFVTRNLYTPFFSIDVVDTGGVGLTLDIWLRVFSGPGGAA